MSTFKVLCEEIFRTISELRESPRSFSIRVQDTFSHYMQDNVLHRPGTVPLQTREGVSAVHELYSELLEIESLPPLEPSHGLTLAAIHHCHDTGPLGIVGHIGSRETSLQKRVESFGKWSGNLVEALDYGSCNAFEVVLSLLIDDGLTTRPHRKALLNPNFTKLGIGAGPHSEFKTVVCLLFSVGFNDNEGLESVDHSDIDVPQNPTVNEWLDGAVKLTSEIREETVQGEKVRKIKNHWEMRDGGIKVIDKIEKIEVKKVEEKPKSRKSSSSSDDSDKKKGETKRKDDDKHDNDHHETHREDHHEVHPEVHHEEHHHEEDHKEHHEEPHIDHHHKEHEEHHHEEHHEEHHHEEHHHEEPIHENLHHEKPPVEVHHHAEIGFHQDASHSAPHHEVPHPEEPTHHEVPHHEVPHHEAPHHEAPHHEESAHHEVPHHEVPHHEVPHHEVPPFVEVTHGDHPTEHHLVDPPHVDAPKHSRNSSSSDSSKKLEKKSSSSDEEDKESSSSEVEDKKSSSSEI